MQVSFPLVPFNLSQVRPRKKLFSQAYYIGYDYTTYCSAVSIMGVSIATQTPL